MLLRQLYMYTTYNVACACFHVFVAPLPPPALEVLRASAQIVMAVAVAAYLTSPYSGACFYKGIYPSLAPVGRVAYPVMEFAFHYLPVLVLGPCTQPWAFVAAYALLHTWYATLARGRIARIYAAPILDTPTTDAIMWRLLPAAVACMALATALATR